MGGESAAATDIDSVAAILIERARPVTFRLAEGPGDIAAAQGLRGRALLDRGWAADDELVDGREIDADDDAATHILAVLDGQPIGACRLVYPDGDNLLPMERRDGAVRLPAPAVEVGRVVAFRSTARRGSVMAGLIGAAWLELRAHAHRRICGTVSASMLRLYRRLGFLVEIIGPPVTILGEERYPILFEPTLKAAAASVGSVAQPG